VRAHTVRRRGSSRLCVAVLHRAGATHRQECLCYQNKNASKMLALRRHGAMLAKSYPTRRVTVCQAKSGRAEELMKGRETRQTWGRLK